ncbi:MAG TPA: helix-hairpin-helix domain-containing protein, partial [Gemmatimonadaceae bacterium]|nr:helix-hairpin-helix domain-containing protein [Gemmatimonadaceae bacterium]
MPTPSERRALLYLSLVVLLGVGVRGGRAVVGAEPVTPAAERALVAQRVAVERAQERTGAKERKKVAGARSPGARASTSKAEPGRVLPGGRRVDVDRASAEELETLPRIGPALARRIVADRDSLGPFGSLEELQRVRGIGPALARGLEGRVTFSGTPRHTGAAGARRRRPRRRG